MFQRTPSSVDERGNKPTDPEWVKTLKPGWQAYRNTNFCSILAGLPVEEDLVGDKWTSLFKKLAQAAVGQRASELSDEAMALLSEIADFQKMNEIRGRVSSTVSDPATAEALKPWYGQWCKRPTFNDEYLPTFNRPNVKLVDTKGKGVDRVTEHAVVVDGVEYEVDCLIFATGFEVGTAYTRRAEFEVYGRDGVSLSELLGEGDEDLPRFPEPRLPEPLPHGAHADRPRAELHLHAGRAGQPHRPCHHGGESSRSEVSGADPRGRG